MRDVYIDIYTYIYIQGRRRQEKNLGKKFVQPGKSHTIRDIETDYMELSGISSSGPIDAALKTQSGGLSVTSFYSISPFLLNPNIFCLSIVRFLDFQISKYSLFKYSTYYYFLAASLTR